MEDGASHRAVDTFFSPFFETAAEAREALDDLDKIIRRSAARIELRFDKAVALDLYVQRLRSRTRRFGPNRRYVRRFRPTWRS